MGVYGYAPPELIEKVKRSGPFDSWAVGVIGFKLFTGINLGFGTGSEVHDDMVDKTIGYVDGGKSSVHEFWNTTETSTQYIENLSRVLTELLTLESSERMDMKTASKLLKHSDFGNRTFVVDNFGNNTLKMYGLGQYRFEPETMFKNVIFKDDYETLGINFLAVHQKNWNRKQDSTQAERFKISKDT